MLRSALRVFACSSPRFFSAAAAAATSAPKSRLANLMPSYVSYIKSMRKRVDVTPPVESIQIDLSRVTIWVNHQEQHLLQCQEPQQAVQTAQQLLETTKFNYLTIIGEYGTIKMRVPFLLYWNPFSRTLDISAAHPSIPEDRFCLLKTYHSKIRNNLVGCSFRYKRRLKLVGMGFKITSVSPLNNEFLNTGKVLTPSQVELLQLRSGIKVEAKPEIKKPAADKPKSDKPAAKKAATPAPQPTQRVIDFHLGRSHLIPFILPSSVTCKVLNKRGTAIQLFSSDLEALNNICNHIRNLHPPEVYTGKGILYHDEVVVRKEGKKK
eukprot:TRINITY_DN1603_c0_g1_i1.p1 TRINITY_DN1603_c0_g1~~TRINITY_DN1603_c0_g1_i1.p1  ORF type:complete len:322 (+),score=130.86 TRINITY_DN1603_c0_g1_i1:82-1047(+)